MKRPTALPVVDGNSPPIGVFAREELQTSRSVSQTVAKVARAVRDDTEEAAHRTWFLAEFAPRSEPPRDHVRMNANSHANRSPRRSRRRR